MQPLIRAFQVSVIYKVFTLLVIVFLSGNIYSLTYTTMANGAWTNGANWSIDGGATSCGCTPANPTAGNDIDILHDMEFGNTNLTITGGSIVSVIANNGKITSSNPAFGIVDVVDGDFLIDNDVELNDLFIRATGNLTLTGWSYVTVESGIDVWGELFVWGGYFQLNSGNFKIEATGVVNMCCASKMEAAMGNMTNFGTIFLAAGTCIETSGAWKNEASGDVSGGGSALTTGGDLKNNGTWGATNWCGGGTPVGVPPMDCATVNDVCGSIILGVSLSSFEAIINEKNEVELLWTTLSETNNDYFLVQRSGPGVAFETIGHVEGNGTTNEEVRYQFSDKNPLNGLSYYRLVQVDFDGSRNEVSPVAVYLKSTEPQVIATYNLMGQEVSENYKGMIVDVYEDGSTVKRFKH